MMRQTEDILISVQNQHAINMLSGKKTAEVRRRHLRIRPGTRIWVYSKLPRGHIELVAITEKVIVAPPSKLWRLYHPRIAITLSEFMTYLGGVDVGCVILFRRIEPLRPALKLAAMRRISAAFHPPQSF